MDLNTSCVCCGKRFSRGNKLPVIMKAFVFLGAQLFSPSVPDNSFICNTCRWMYKNAHYIVIYIEYCCIWTYQLKMTRKWRKDEKSKQNLSDSSHMDSNDEDAKLLCIF